MKRPYDLALLGPSMRMPRFRYTVRWLMLAVAIVALILVLTPKAFTFALRWNYKFQMAKRYRDSARSLRTSAIAWREIDIGCIPSPPTTISEYRRDKMFQTAEDYDRLALKYDRAARCPWLPDPPERE